jgi:cell division protein FtsQ
MIVEPRRRTVLSRLRPAAQKRWLGWRLALALAALVLVILGVGFLWLRSSSLVAIHRVQVTGLSGPNVGQITRTLKSRAKTMTTLDVAVSALLRSVSAYPYVRSLSVSTHFPHAVTIDVLEQVPLATVSVGGRTLVVNGSGEMLPGSVRHSGPLPSVGLGQLRRSGAGDVSAANGVGADGDANRITGQAAVAALHVLAAAPYRFLSHIKSATETAAHGVVVQLRDGPQVYFGPRGRARAKWTSAFALLAARGSNAVAGAQYLDVSDPRSPSVGAQISQP